MLVHARYRLQSSNAAFKSSSMASIVTFRVSLWLSYQLFDIYEGSQIRGGYKSMAYALVFRDHDKTLEESEISAAMKKILNGLEGLGIELRS